MLVALAIFGTVMAGISIVFLSSLRAWHASRETQSVFEMGRAALRVMEQDITTAFGSVERGELGTLVGGPDWLSFVGITENPKTSPNPTWDPTPHSDIARITYRLWPGEPAAGEERLVLRLVEPNAEGMLQVPFPDLLEEVAAQAVSWWELALDREVAQEDFELASNILRDARHRGLEFRYRDIDRVTRTARWVDSWDSRNRLGEERRLPDAVEVVLSVRAEAKVVTPETKVRVFRETIFLPLGYRRPLPAALQ